MKRGKKKIMKGARKKAFAWFSIDRQEILKTAKFAAVFAGVLAVLHILVSFLIPLEWIEYLVALKVSFALSLLGIESAITIAEPVVMQVSGLTVFISYLCTGVLETLVLAAAIAGSLGIGWRKRAVGIIAGIAAAFAFNVVRIVATILLLLGAGIATAELAHDLLFRLSLFVVIAGFYALWFMWAVKGERGNKAVKKKRKGRNEDWLWGKEEAFPNQ